jgi:hypothetical protein
MKVYLSRRHKARKEYLSEASPQTNKIKNQRIEIKGVSRKGAKSQSRKESKIFNTGLNPNQSLAFLGGLAALREKLFLVELATLKLDSKLNILVFKVL